MGLYLNSSFLTFFYRKVIHLSNTDRSFLLSVGAGDCAPLFSPCLPDLPFRSRLKDSRSDFLKDFRLDIGASPTPERSVYKQLQILNILTSIFH